MTVNELIEELKKQDGDYIVHIKDGEWDEEYDIDAVQSEDGVCFIVFNEDE